MFEYEGVGCSSRRCHAGAEAPEWHVQLNAVDPPDNSSGRFDCCGVPREDVTDQNRDGSDGFGEDIPGRATSFLAAALLILILGISISAVANR